jgi:hypothetical protein
MRGGVHDVRTLASDPNVARQLARIEELIRTLEQNRRREIA